MKTIIFVLVTLLAALVAAEPNCGAGGAPDAYRPSMCNCYSGFAPSTKASTDCDFNPLCPLLERDEDITGQYGANRPVTSFAADRLNIYQSLPIVQNRLGATIRFVHPYGLPGVTAGASGSSSCGYPGNLWNKTVNELSCMDEFRGSIPWNSNGMCGFVLDTVQSTNSTAIYKTMMVTQVNDTFTWKGKTEVHVSHTTYAISVSFLKQKQVSSLLVKVSMDSPVLTLLVLGSVDFDSLTSTTLINLRTSASWPYKIDPTSIAFASFLSSLPADQAPPGVYAQITEDTSAALSCDGSSKTPCLQQWSITIFLGEASTCDIQGSYTFASNLLCRDGAPCGGAPSGSFSFSLLGTDFCTVSSVDASADGVYQLRAFEDASHQDSTVSFGIGHIVYFGLSVFEPSSTLKSITFASIALVPPTGPKDILYSTEAGVTAVTGVGLTRQEITNQVIAPGQTANLAFSFQLMGINLANSLAPISLGSSVSLQVEATVNLVYYNSKRETRVVMESLTGSATTQIQVVPEADQFASASFVYTIPFLTIALLSAVLL